ncbi:hypothetical protein DSM03_10821 [Leeuwenhoekiella aestuarii]|uniref:hypothetical protein n=1 Tax=Leeuwenhoekiella aestuarii TaxID=2249426 RepID=UPI000FFE8BF3|nr:hypothetical protein [Leeuwenhoekiella aestuarii]RXG12876.1 hypothetical protein DSM03_10821 [Leeuwenhoekiella aestuarii]
MNNKNLFVIIVLLFAVKANSQNDSGPKWISQVYVDLNASNKSSYEYYDLDNKARETSINGKGSLELVYNIDYKIFKKFAAVGIAGIANYNNPSFASFKTGLGFKLLYVDNKYHYLTLQYGYLTPFNKSDFREGHQIKIGQVFDVANLFNQRLLVGLYYTNDFFYMENSEPLISNASRSFSLNASSFGISLGMKFQ